MADSSQAGTMRPQPQEVATRTGRQEYVTEFFHHFALDAGRVSLVVTDLQYAGASRTHGFGRLLAEQGREAEGQYKFDRIEQVVVPNVRTLLQFFRARGLRVIHLTLGSELADYRDLPVHMRIFAQAVGNTRGRREHEILDEVRPEPGEIVINKTTASAFTSTSIDATLRTLGITDLVITGITTSCCVETTARDAADRGYRCVLVEDGCGATWPEFHEAALASFCRVFGRVASTRAVIEELELSLAR